MGNREDLLAGAKRCLLEKGYARTTARDIAATAGTSLAAIGYHFKTTEALLNAALFEAMREWGEELGRNLGEDGDPDAPPAERFATIWRRMIESFAAQRGIWSAQFEFVTLAAQLPELREFYARAQEQARPELAGLFRAADPAADPEAARLVGTLYQALLAGVAMQWLVDPEHAPSGEDLARALRIAAASLEPSRD
ncbi:helix-turn-helix domain-containing protein [Micromonospora sp. NPDC049559]|uniref:TetR/AcrR family transcriptional regulator n=1 Tax=Micromonospora sp. NPDC049559 TaxID=3155923 RepID=UPI00343CDCD4